MDLDLDEYSIQVKEEVETQVKRWMPFLGVDKVKVTETPDRNQYNITIKGLYPLSTSNNQDNGDGTNCDCVNENNNVSLDFKYLWFYTF